MKKDRSEAMSLSEIFDETPDVKGSIMVLPLHVWNQLGAINSIDEFKTILEGADDSEVKM